VTNTHTARAKYKWNAYLSRGCMAVNVNVRMDTARNFLLRYASNVSVSPQWGLFTKRCTLYGLRNAAIINRDRHVSGSQPNNSTHVRSLHHADKMLICRKKISGKVLKKNMERKLQFGSTGKDNVLCNISIFARGWVTVLGMVITVTCLLHSHSAAGSSIWR
jgi:hypothetical protein